MKQLPSVNFATIFVLNVDYACMIHRSNIFGYRNIDESHVCVSG